MDQARGILHVCNTILNSTVTKTSGLEEDVFRNQLSIPSYPRDLLFLSFLVHFKTSSAATFSKSSCRSVSVHYQTCEEVLPRGCSPASQNAQQKDHG